MGAATLTTSTATPSLGSYAGISSPPPTAPVQAAIWGNGREVSNAVQNSPERVPTWQREQFRLLDTARALFPEDERLQRCHRVRVSRSAPVAVRQLTGGRVAFGNVQTCGRLHCPVCGPRIRSRRSHETVRIARAAAATGYSSLLATWTYGHGEQDALPDMLALQEQAFRKMGSGKNAVSQRVRRAGGEFRGSRRAEDYTHGAHGHHPHVHGVLFVQGVTVPDVTGMLWDAWGGAATAVGLVLGRDALQVQEIDPSGAGYLYKPGYDLAHDTDSRIPAQLLRDAARGDEHAGQVWAAYARATAGRCATVTTPGLRRLLIDGDVLADGQDTRLSQVRVPDSALLLTEFHQWQGVTPEVFELLAAC